MLYAKVSIIIESTMNRRNNNGYYFGFLQSAARCKGPVRDPQGVPGRALPLRKPANAGAVPAVLRCPMHANVDIKDLMGETCKVLVYSVGIAIFARLVVYSAKSNENKIKNTYSYEEKPICYSGNGCPQDQP